LTAITNTANQAHGWAGAASKLITDPNTGAVTGWGFADGSGIQWAGAASKLITDPNTGAVTGWGFADGSGIQSAFKINADKFTLEDSNNATTPFLEIDNVAHTAKFNGTVTFGSSQINGGVIIHLKPVLMLQVLIQQLIQLK